VRITGVLGLAVLRPRSATSDGDNSLAAKRLVADAERECVTLAKDMLLKILHTGAIIALLTGVASAQMLPSINLGSQDRPMTPEEKEKQKAIEDAYKSAIRKIPEQKPVDPWGAVRQNPSPASKSKQGQQ
jgi:hypothetical protein